MGCPDIEGEPTLAQKVAFLGRADTWTRHGEAVIAKETHMSWVFLVGDRVYKLKKPVRFPYLDFSTLARREAACRAELALNRRLAPDVYLAMVPLLVGPDGLTLSGDGQVVDWLVVMRRLDEAQTLEHAIGALRLRSDQLDPLAGALSRFYRRASAMVVAPELHLRDWQQKLSDNRCVLLDRRLDLPSGPVRRIDNAQRRFLKRSRHDLVRRLRGHGLVDGHGDLRPEHVWLTEPVRIIDCLEFSQRLRVVDPLDEIASLDVECARLGASWAGAYLRRRLVGSLRQAGHEPLYRFYRSYRAMLRARLAIAHLQEPAPRMPEKWPALARSYLKLALADAIRLEQCFRRPEGH